MVRPIKTLILAVLLVFTVLGMGSVADSPVSSPHQAVHQGYHSVARFIDIRPQHASAAYTGFIYYDHQPFGYCYQERDYYFQGKWSYMEYRWYPYSGCGGYIGPWIR